MGEGEDEEFFLTQIRRLSQLRVPRSLHMTMSEERERLAVLPHVLGVSRISIKSHGGVNLSNSPGEHDYMRVTKPISARSGKV